MKLKSIFLCGIFLFGLVISTSAQSSNQKVLYVVDGGRRSEIAKYLYKDLYEPLRRKYNSKISIDFIDFNSAGNIRFSDYAAVIVVNERNTKGLNTHVLNFVNENKNESNMLVLAFLPRGSNLQNNSGIDVISSASDERPAANLVKTEVARRVYQLL